ncbi:SDR family oxidoreductase [Streptomyces tremellae]|uniref:HTH lysR-type domain-containing protein n=1 Tax=Streptomyces tremellae TaxID=1124239 RepID=A0ABP7FVV7_9ACTN
MDVGHAGALTFAGFEMFLALSRNEHFGQAAAELGVSAATVQRTVRALERKPGVALIEQSARRVRMLHSGHVLVREAQAVLRARPDAVDTTRAESGVPHRRLRIAHTHSLGLCFVPDVLADLLGAHPELRFRCWQSSATNVVSALLRGEADRVHVSAAKHGLVGLTLALAEACAGDGSTVNAVSPGHLNAPAEAETARDRAEVAAAVAFLASPPHRPPVSPAR